MEEDAIRHEVNVKDIPTKTVTLYPSGALIVREIEDLIIRPGRSNEIEIYGITPTADEQSVQVDGRGSAVITDMTVDLVPNREIFEDVYPQDSESDSDDDGSSSSSDSPSDEAKNIRSLTKEIKKLQVEFSSAMEKQNSADDRLSILKDYSRTLHAKENSASALDDTLKLYGQEREALHADHAKAGQTMAELTERIGKLTKRKGKLLDERSKAKAKKEKARDKALAKLNRQKLQRRQEADRVRAERLKYWPKKVYRVVLRLEPSSVLTPTMSRRSSMDSITLAETLTKDDTANESLDLGGPEVKILLSLSYFTKEASWWPHYDLSVSSIKKQVTISYRAEFTNHTSETWKDAKVYLSTSQTSYSGLADSVPTMQVWRVKLSKEGGGNDPGKGLLTWQEQSGFRHGNVLQKMPASRSNLFGLPSKGRMICAHCNGEHWTQGCPSTKKYTKNKLTKIPFGLPPSGIPANTGGSLGGLFGSSSGTTTGTGLFGAPANNAADPRAIQNYQMQLMQLEQENKRRLMLGRQEHEKGQQTQQGSQQAQQAQQAQQQMQMAQRVANPPMPVGAPMSQPPPPPPPGGFAGFGSTLGSVAPSGPPRNGRGGGEGPEAEGLVDSVDYSDEELDLVHEEAQWEDNGMTATYDVPGTRTIAPSSLTRRHKIATLTASNADISYVAVPKLRNAAFLRAKIRNPSSAITLLKGSAGVRLDGTFLGNMTLQRTSPGQIIELPLGVDPGVGVSYPKPAVRRSTQGIFTKEAAQVYSRAIWLTNTKPTPIALRVIDQVPVSEDERLRIDVLTPKGLKSEGSSVRAGVSARDANLQGGAGASTALAAGQEHGMREGKWGSATATMRKNGEVVWEVKLEKGGACLLGLEYEAKLPSTEEVVQA